MTKSENDGERRAELMRDIGEECLAHLGESFQSQMVAAVDAVHVEEHDKSAHKKKHNGCEDYAAHKACRLFAREIEMHLVDNLFLKVALDEKSGVLNAVHLLHVHHAVAHGDSFLMRSESSAVVAHTLIMFII